MQADCLLGIVYVRNSMHEKSKLTAIQKAFFFFLDGFNIFSLQITLLGILILIEVKLIDFCLLKRTSFVRMSFVR